MIYMLIPRGETNWEHVRLFTSFSAVEDVMKRGSSGWCFTIGFDGVDELNPIYVYMLDNNTIIRKPILLP